MTDADGVMLDELADAIAKRHLATPALFFLESMRPLSFVGSQMMVFLRPMIAMLWTNPLRWDQLQRVLEERGSVEEPRAGSKRGCDVASGTDETALGDTAVPVGPAGDVDLPEVSPQRYQIAGEVGRGGLGRVVEAKDRFLDRKVALKELLATDGQSRRRFVREALITARLQHPSIVPVYDAGRWPDRAPFYAMKLVAGERLLDKIKGSLEERLALVPVVLAVADAIGYAHSERIVHRDLKPQNVLVGAFGETVVIDWGLAKDLATEDHDALDAGPYRKASADHTIDGTVMGTPAYMAPEQAEGHEVDERADVYALGAMLYHVISGRAPHLGDSADQMIERIVAGAVDPLATVAHDVPTDLAAIVTKAMARVPADRYRNAAVFAEDLRRFTTGQLVAVHRYTAGERFRRWLRRYRAVVAVAAVAVIVLVAFGTWSIRRIVTESRERGERYRDAVASSNRAVIAQARGSLTREPAESLAWLTQLAVDGPGWDQARVIAADALNQPRLEHYIRGSVIDDNNWFHLDWTRDGDMLFRFGNDEVAAYDLAHDTMRSYKVPEGLQWAPCADHRHAYGMNVAIINGAQAAELELATGTVLPMPSRSGEDWRGLARCTKQRVFELTFPVGDEVAIWDGDDRHVLTSNVRQAWISRDRDHVVVRDHHNVITWWDVTTAAHERLGTVTTKSDLPMPTMSRDGKVVVFPGTPDQIMRVGSPQQTEAAELALVSGDGQRFAFVARENSPSTVEITDADLASVGGLDANGRLMGMQFSDDRVQVFGFGDRTAIWDLDTRMRAELGEDRAHHLDFVIDDARIARWSTDGSLRVWRLTRPHVLAVTHGYLAAISPNSRWAADDTPAGAHRLALDGKTPPEVMPPILKTRIMTKRAVSNAGDMLLEDRETVVIWRRGAEPMKYGKPASGARLRWSNAGVPQMWGDRELWDLSGATARLVWTTPPQHRMLSVSDDLRHAALIDDTDQSVQIVEIPSGRATKVAMQPTFGIAFSTDDRYVAGPALDDGGVVVVDTATLAVRTIPTPGTRAVTLEFSKSGTWLAAVGATSLSAIDLVTGTAHALETRGGLINDVAIDDVGLRLTASSADGTQLYDLRSGESRALSDSTSQWAELDGDRIVLAIPSGVIDLVDDLPHDPAALAARIRALPFEIRDGHFAMRR